MRFDANLYMEALKYAVSVHCKQRRGNGDPYILHVMRVSTTVLSLDLPKDMQPFRTEIGIAGLLHDAIEDAGENDLDPQNVAFGIERSYGKAVLDLVKELTQDASLPKPERRAHMVAHCGSMSKPAQIIKLADRLDNVSEMRGMSAKFIERYCEETPQMLLNMKGACPELEARIEDALRPYVTSEQEPLS